VETNTVERGGLLPPAQVHVVALSLVELWKMWWAGIKGGAIWWLGYQAKQALVSLCDF